MKLVLSRIWISLQMEKKSMMAQAWFNYHLVEGDFLNHMLLDHSPIAYGRLSVYWDNLQKG